MGRDRRKRGPETPPNTIVVLSQAADDAGIASRCIATPAACLARCLLWRSDVEGAVVLLQELEVQLLHEREQKARPACLPQHPTPFLSVSACAGFHSWLTLSRRQGALQIRQEGMGLGIPSWPGSWPELASALKTPYGEPRLTLSPR